MDRKMFSIGINVRKTMQTCDMPTMDKRTISDNFMRNNIVDSQDIVLG